MILSNNKIIYDKLDAWNKHIEFFFFIPASVTLFTECESFKWILLFSERVKSGTDLFHQFTRSFVNAWNGQFNP